MAIGATVMMTSATTSPSIKKSLIATICLGTRVFRLIRPTTGWSTNAVMIAQAKGCSAWAAVSKMKNPAIPPNQRIVARARGENETSITHRASATLPAIGLPGRIIAGFENGYGEFSTAVLRARTFRLDHHPILGDESRQDIPAHGSTKGSLPNAQPFSPSWSDAT